MKQQWQDSELIEHLTLLPDERGLVEGYEVHNQLCMAIQLKVFQYQTRFPVQLSETTDNSVPESEGGDSQPQTSETDAVMAAHLVTWHHAFNLRIEALIELIEERSFDVLTVGEITERAMVSRAAFYRN